MGLKKLLGLREVDPIKIKRAEEIGERERREIARRQRSLQMELEVIKRARS